jgi:D,D-heptose 1,7-bisphosphate phosphatase
MASPTNRAVILDRDGVINVDRGYVHRLEDFELIPGVLEALGLLPADFKIVIVTNQSGIGRGLFTHEQFRGFMEVLQETLSQRQIRLDGVYYCPHTPSEGCTCRKPATGLLDQAVNELGLDRRRSYVIGDQTSDIKMGEDGGCRTILVKTGTAGRDGRFSVNPDCVAEDLHEAIQYVLGEESGNA